MVAESQGICVKML